MEKRSRIFPIARYLLYPMLFYEMLTAFFQLLTVQFGWKSVLGPNQLSLQIRGLGGAAALPFLLCWYCRSRKGHKWRPLGISTVLTLALPAIGYSMVANYLVLFVSELVGNYEFYNTPILKTALLFKQLILVGLLLPLVEELVFRGLGYFQIRELVSFKKSVLLTAVFFALYHGNIKQGAYAFFGGIILAVIFEIYDSLLAVWFFHMVMNAASVIMSCRLSCRYFAQGAVQAQDFQYIPGILVGGALLLLGLYKIRKDGKNRETIVHSNTVL